MAQLLIQVKHKRVHTWSRSNLGPKSSCKITSKDLRSPRPYISRSLAVPSLACVMQLVAMETQQLHFEQMSSAFRSDRPTPSPFHINIKAWRMNKPVVNVLTTLFYVLHYLKHAPLKFNRNKLEHSFNYICLFHILRVSLRLIWQQQ